MPNQTTAVPKIDLDAIKASIYADPTIRARILRDFGVSDQPPNPAAFVDAVIGTFGRNRSTHRSISRSQIRMSFAQL